MKQCVSLYLVIVYIMTGLAIPANAADKNNIYGVLANQTNVDPNAANAADKNNIYGVLANQTNVDPNAANAQEDNSEGTNKTKKTNPPTIREEAFKQLLNKTFPLRPEQIIEYHKELNKSHQAMQTHPTTPPQPMSSTLTVDLAPGGTPPVIRLATGFVTSIVFVDITGQPWPVLDYSLGNPKHFNIQWDKKTNALFIQGTASYVTANLAVRLAELDTPIMISLVTGQKEVDYRIDLQIHAQGPNALAPIVEDNLPTKPAASLLSILDGVPPTGSVELKVAGNYGRAWMYNNKLLLRTKLTLLSPAWTASVSSPDGTRVYELIKTPLILASQNGKPIKIELSGM